MLRVLLLTRGDEREGGARVDDAGSAGKDRRRCAVPDRLVDAEEQGGGGRARDRSKAACQTC